MLYSYLQNDITDKEDMMEKNTIVTVTITDIGVDGEGIGKVNGYTLFIKDAVIGDVVEAKVMKAKKNYGYARLMKILAPSPHRISPKCAYARSCGGCQIQEMSYERQLQFKQDKVKGNLERIGGFDASFLEKIMEPVVGMEKPFHYRNKAQFPFGTDREGQPVTGFYAGRTHDIIANTDCALGVPVNKEILEHTLAFMRQYHIPSYDEKTGKGLIRHIVTKIGIKTNEIMCVLVVNGKEISKEKELITEIIEHFPEIKTIVKNVNTKNTNVILGQENINLYGNGYIEDKLGDYTFKISPLSFYQVNPVQAEKLYLLGIDGANITKKDVVFDLYCGIGTISLFMSKFAKKVYGIEIVEEAVAAAKENAVINQVDNVDFIAGDVEKVLDDFVNAKGIIPEIIMVDPPRRGLDNTTIDNILNVKPKRLVYISCNPATLVRDLAKLEELYDVKSIKPVDMFPFTSSVECCSVLQLKQDM